MIAPNKAEIKGTFQESPFAELLVETMQAELSGSFRLAHVEEKAIIYMKNGEIIFAVSNLRQHRLFEMLLQTERVSKDILTNIPNFTNDLELAESLIAQEVLTKTEIDEFFIRQIKSILTMAITWQTGAWSFSHLARAKEGVEFKIDTPNLLLNYARILSDETVIKRFKSFDERFALKKYYPAHLNLLPSEGFIFSRVGATLMKIQELKTMSGLSDLETMKNLYVLWLAGFLVRKNWNCIFSESHIQSILSAKLTLIKETPRPTVPTVEVNANSPQDAISTEVLAAQIDEKRLLDEYLKRVEDAESYYEILDVPVKSNLIEIKTAYFNLAKQFHPDKYHQEKDVEVQRRVQHAFTEIARSYETLKDESTREVYDFKLRKYLESIKDQKVSNQTSTTTNESENARLEFEQGFSYLMEENYEEALPYLARAAHLSPDNARFRAYHGKVLATDETQRHKAEAEIQTAIKLDPNNSSFRIMLVEFFVQYNLLKRAEGELNRILTQFPNNKEAQIILDSLQN